MDFWIKAAQLLLSLSILVFLHELGHFIPARLFKTRVEKFYLFFNPWFSLYKRKIGETEWGIGWLPLGGYVKISGMVDESMDKEQLAQPAQPWEFRSKPAWQRLIIMIGGVTVNIIVGFLIYGMVLGIWGEDQIHSKDLQAGHSIHPYMQKFGLRSGDNILEINDQPIVDPNDITAGVMFRNQYKLKVQKADGTIETITLHEDVEYELYENGALPIAGLRHASTEVNVLAATKTITADSLWPAEKGRGENDLNAGQILVALNGKSINAISSITPYLNSKNPLYVKTIDGKDTITINVNPAQKEAFFSAFPALKAGLKAGDKIIAIGDRKIVYFDEIVEELYNHKKKTVDVVAVRGNDTLTLPAQVSEQGTIGFSPVGTNYIDSSKFQTISYGFFGSLSHGTAEGITSLTDYAGQLKFLFTKKGASSIGGFASIGNMFAPTWDWKVFWQRTALISIILAFMNILPIPALDGGHVVFLLYEIITRREAPQKVLEYAQMVGFFILIALLLYANGNDIIKAIM